MSLLSVVEVAVGQLIATLVVQQLSGGANLVQFQWTAVSRVIGVRGPLDNMALYWSAVMIS